jgi:cytochrome c553
LVFAFDELELLMMLKTFAGALLFRVASAFWAAGAAAQTAAPTNAEPAKAAVCATCHGPNGNSTQPETPSLAGQTNRYLYLQLRDFQEGRRSNALMTPMAAGLTREETHELANWYAQQKLQPLPFKVDSERAKLGKAKADETLCTMCHLGGFLGQNEIPRIAGQHHDYVVKQLGDFKARRRTNDAGNMTSVSRTLSDEDIENLAHYLASL